MGKLVFAPAANEKGAAYASFDFKVRDNGGTANTGVDLDPTANTITINVTSVNDAPAGTDKTVSINQHPSSTLFPYTTLFRSPNDTPPNAFASVKITAIAGGGSLKLSGNP